MQVGLFVTCLVDLMRPSVGLAALRLLEHAQCTVVFPPHQTCCGQPAFNSGDMESTKMLARKLAVEFKDVDYVVVPSGSCASMIKTHYLELFADDEASADYQNCVALSMKTFELTDFLVNVAKIESLPEPKSAEHTLAELPKSLTYHDSCSGLRELGVKNQPRELINLLKQKYANQPIELVEMADGQSETCCGFGGAFSVKFPEISTKIASQKCNCIEATKAQAVVGGDVGCLLNIEGTSKKLNQNLETWHIAELLAGAKTIKNL